MTAFQGPIHVLLRPSVRAPRVLGALHAAAACAVVSAWPWSGWLAGLLGAMALSGWHAACAARGGAPDAVQALLLDSGDGWRVTLRSGAVHEARLAGEPFVTSALTVVALRLDTGAIRRVVLHADNCDRAAWRRLRVRLLHPSQAGRP